MFSGDHAGSLEHATALRDALADRGPSRALAEGLMGRAVALSNLGRPGEAAENARRSLAVAREIGDRTREGLALAQLCFAARGSDDLAGAVRLARQAAQIAAGVPGSYLRWWSSVLTMALIAAGDMSAADDVCAAGLARARDAGDVYNQWDLLPQMALLDVQAGRTGDAAAHLREGIQLSVRAGSWLGLLYFLDSCGFLCAATGRTADAVTMWAAYAALSRQQEYAEEAPPRSASGTSLCVPPARRSDPTGPVSRKNAARR